MSPYAVIVTMLVNYLVLGMFLDDFAIVFIVSMQTAYITPPFG